LQLTNSGLEIVAHGEGTHFSFNIEAGKRIVFVRFEKKLTAADVRRYAERVRAHPEFNPEFSEMVDLTEVEDLDLHAHDFLKLADEIDCFSVRAWRAFIVSNSVQSHAARMHKILRTPDNMRIFSSLEQARAWIESRPAISG
jgi:SpoIIAA-like